MEGHYRLSFRIIAAVLTEVALVCINKITAAQAQLKEKKY